FFGLMLLTTAALAQSGEYTLVWSDEFSGNGAVASDLWFHQTQLPAGGSWYNNEQQHYTNRIENSSVANGLLKIVAKKESFTNQSFTKQYTSARLNSKFAFTYGRVDARAKLPTGAGTWPAIWMLGKNINEPGGFFSSQFGTTNWPATGEIDIMEHWGNNPNVIHGSIHTTSSSGNTINTKTINVTQVSSTFHIYSIIWDEEKIQFLVDDVPFYTYNPPVKNASTWPFDKPQYLLLNIAMGGVGGAIDAAFTQSSMEIDYVRVYQKGVTPPVNSQTITFPAIGDKTVGDAPFALMATASSNLPISYSTTSDKVTISGSTATIVKAGRVIVKANQAGSASFNAAPEVAQSFCIKPLKPTVIVSQPTTGTFLLTSSSSTGNKWFLNGNVIVSATNSTFTTTTLGNYKVQVTEDDCVSKFSTDVEVNLKDNQTISFTAIPDKTVGDAPFALTATATSSLGVAFTADSDRVTISGNTATIVKAGRTIIKANQGGNDSFNAAPEVTRSFCIKPAKPIVTVIGINVETIILTSNTETGNKWFLNGTVIPSATNATLPVTAPGIYKVQVTIDGCVSEFSADVPLIVTGDLVGVSSTVSSYPNPAENYLELSGIKGELSGVQLVDLAGRRNTIEFEKRGDVYHANVQHLTQGIYLLQLKEESRIRRIKVVKK
ncbi:MAG: family 16 glycosylhydrolase, partial [Cyclobacteriaceae bacterium]